MTSTCLSVHLSTVPLPQTLQDSSPLEVAPGWLFCTLPGHSFAMHPAEKLSYELTCQYHHSGSISCPMPMHRTLVEVNRNMLIQGSISVVFCIVHSVLLGTQPSCFSVSFMGGRSFCILTQLWILQKWLQRNLRRVFVTHVLLLLTVNILMSVQFLMDTYDNKTLNSDIQIPNSFSFILILLSWCM